MSTEDFNVLVRNFVVKTSGGNDKFIPESFRDLDFGKYMGQKVVRTNFGNMIEVDQDDDEDEKESKKN